MNGRNAAASIAPIGAADESTQPMDNCDARTDGQTDRQTDGRVSTMQPHRAYLYLSAAGMLRLAGRCPQRGD